MTLELFPAGARRLVALRALGMLSSDDLPEVALLLLELPGSPSAAALAGATSGDDPRARAELFDKALGELGLDLPSKLEAAKYLRLQISREVVRGELGPREAAELIRDLHDAVEFELPRGHRLGAALGVDEVIGLYYAFDGARTAADCSQIERELLAAFRAIAVEEADSS